MSEIIDSLLEQGCEIKEIDNPNNAVVCSKSFIQKNMDKPWSLFVKSKGLESIGKSLDDFGGISVSGIGMGSLEEEGAWSKIKQFQVGRHADVKIYDKELFKSGVKKNKRLDSGIKRLKRLSNNYITDYPAVNVGAVAESELSDIQIELERMIEDKFTKEFGDTVCSSYSNAKRMWTPQRNDILRFEVNMKCVLPDETVEGINQVVEKIGDRKTFKTVHRDGINSIVTPDDQMYLRKIVLHDKDLGGPFMVFGIRDNDILKKDNFIEKVRGIESHLGK